MWNSVDCICNNADILEIVRIFYTLDEILSGQAQNWREVAYDAIYKSLDIEEIEEDEE